MNLLRKVAHFFLYHGYVRWKLTRTDEATVCGFRLRVPPTVFHPSFYLTSRFFGSALMKRDFHGMKGLDVGCGSGLLSLVAASRGARMVSLDINPAAVTAMMENAALNKLEMQIVPLRSDLFAGLSPMHKDFDFILCNPPFYTGEPSDLAEHAWRGGQEYAFLRRLAAESGSHLRPGGSILFVLSSDVDVTKILGFFHDAHFSTSIVAQKRYLFESLLVVEASSR